MRKDKKLLPEGSLDDLLTKTSIVIDPILEMINASNVRELIDTMAKAVKKLTNSTSIDILLIDSALVSQY